MSSFGIILLAAGNATRMGSPKQLLDFNGMPLVRHAVTEAIASECSPVIVVCGAVVDAIRQALAGLTVQLTFNPLWSQGMGTSIQCGLRALQPHPADGVILSLIDQPLIDRRCYRELVAIHEQTGLPIVSSEYSGTVGVPVLFTREFFPNLHGLAPSQGCKSVIQGNRDHTALFSCPDAAADIDTPDDYAQVLAEFRRRQTA